MTRFGSGAKGGIDGVAAQASFNSPQGLVADETAIYVADTGNHAIRRIDRASGEVSTLSGNGERGMNLLNRFEKASARSLASPWDLEIKNHYLFFANAGTHQIGAIDLSQDALRLVAGTGDENLLDGRVLAAHLAQPSALALSADGQRLYFADSETSSIRYLDMQTAQIVTLVGAGLFEFGHVNGKREEARLQHALGLTLLDEKRIVIADSYNHALRIFDMETGRLDDIEELTCTDSLCLPFAEPAGICADGPSRLLVSDTNQHRIVEVDLAARTMREFA